MASTSAPPAPGDPTSHGKPLHVEGVRVVGDKVVGIKAIPLVGPSSAPDEPCPIAHAAGIPISVRRQKSTGQTCDLYLISRIMSDPQIGLAPPSWQFGGSLHPAPPVLMFRTDGVPFTVNDFYMLDDFEVRMLDDGPEPVSRADWMRFATCYEGMIDTSVEWTDEMEEAAEARMQSGEGPPPARGAVLALEAHYPAGAKVRAFGLKGAQELNGVVGVAAGGVHYMGDRVGVRFPEPFGLKALKAANLEKVTA